MASTELKRKTAFFFAFAGTILLILLVFPFVEGIVQEYLRVTFNIVISHPEGTATRVSDGPPIDMMTVTAIQLAVNLIHVIKVFLWMMLVIACVRYLGFLVLKAALRRSAQSEIAGLTKTVLSIVIYIVAFFIIFQSQYPNVDLGALFTGSTIIGIVVGLALQDTLGNLFAGIALQADQPFQVGDVVNISNRGTGIVESVSWRGVKIRTFQNKLLIISNAVLGKETIEVAPRDNLNARIVFFNTVYTDSPSRTAQFVREAVRQVDNVSQKIRPIVRIRNLGADGIDWEIKYWCEDYSRYNETDSQIRQRIWYVFKREGIDFAYPTRTVYMQPAPKETDTNEYISSASEQIVRVPIFSPLSEDEIQKLAQASKTKVFAPGETIVRRGAEGNSMFIIVRGAVNVRIPVKESLRTINHLQTNDFFGEMSLLTGEPRSATVIAEEETEVLEIRKKALKPIIEANPELTEAIGEIIQQRRELLNPAISMTDIKIEPDKGLIKSLKNFFGLD
ncbi:MAG: mechanosensitive ion channel family protein [Pyrinomonadaceae bacterium]|nr:mechanosensitive ion channel family protein [Pyrinomonadaceae bacterium]